MIHTLKEAGTAGMPGIDINGAEIIRMNVGTLTKMDGCNLNGNIFMLISFRGERSFCLD